MPTTKSTKPTTPTKGKQPPKAATPAKPVKPANGKPVKAATPSSAASGREASAPSVNTAGNAKQRRRASQQYANAKEHSLKHRPVIHDHVFVVVYHGNTALTLQQAMELLGWDEEGVGESKNLDFGEKYDFVNPVTGKKVRCWNNRRNRNFKTNNGLLVMQEHLRKRWKLNGEALIIGNTGECISCQHRLGGFIFAVQEYRKNPNKYQEFWQDEPTMETLIVYGVDEADETVNTIDTGMPRTLSDVLFRGPHFQSFKDRSDRDKASTMAENAIKQVWYRTGVGTAFDVDLRTTHSEYIDFLDRHAKLIKCVKHLFEESKNGKIRKLLGPGYAAGLCYLMASSTTEGDAYRKGTPPSEALMDWSNEDTAMNFWVEVAASDKKLAYLQQALKELGNANEQNNGDGKVSLAERMALVIKAWLCVLTKKPLTVDTIDLLYRQDEDGFRVLNECPTTGGIDLGNPTHPGTSGDEEMPTPKEVAERTAQERATKINSKKKGGPKLPDVKIGDVVWCPEPEAGGHYSGMVTELYNGPHGMVVQLKVKSGRKYEEPMANCLLMDPDA